MLTQFEQVWDRIKAGTGLSTQNDVAEALSITQPPISDAKKRGVFPAEWALKIASAYNLSTDWIMTGEGPMARESGVVAESEAGYNSSKVRNEYIYVPRYDVQASAGHGAINENEAILDHLAFKSDWVKNKLGVDGKTLALITASGDSMEPTIQEDDLLLLDTAVNEVQEDGIYCIKNEFNLQIKRIQRMMGKELVIKSDNPAYQPFTVGPDQLEFLEVVGRVVWYGRQI
jgi:phage repressor protein C with HTH and peptisase S24 domain